MARPWIALAPVLAAVAALALGQGLLHLVVTVRADQAGLGPGAVGLMMSAFYLGFMGGAALAPRLLSRWGAPAAMAALALLSAGAALALGAQQALTPVLLLRVLNGAASAGVLVLAETWLNAAADPASRGRVFALYTGTFYLAASGGQLLLPLLGETGWPPFLAAAAALALAAAIGRVGDGAPRLEAPARGDPAKALRLAPVGMLATFASGLLFGALEGVGPVLALSAGLDLGGTARFMAVALAGAFLGQLPASLAGDRWGRRATLRATAGLLVATSLLGAGGWAAGPGLLLPAGALYGALAGALYPLGIADIGDRCPPASLAGAISVAVTGWALGSMVGPALAGALQGLTGPGALFACSGVLALALGAAAGRSRH